MIAVVFALVVLALAAYIFNSVRKPKNFPPGPEWIPFFGCSSVVQNVTRKYGSQWKGFSELAKQYSTDVLGLKLGSELVVVVSGDKNIRQVFTEKEFEGRPDSFFIRLRCLGNRMGITFTDGPLWREHRQFTVKRLKNVGFGKTVMEKEIQNELQNIVGSIEENGNQPMNPRNMLASAVMNTLWKYAAGEKIEEDRLKLLLKLLSERSKAFSMAGGWLNQAPWIRFLAPELSGYDLIKSINEQLSSIIEEAIEKHKSKKVEGDDFIYSFLNEMQEKKDSFTEMQLKTVCLDLLIAGSQTTSNVLEFSLLTLLRNQKLQERIFNEIDNAIGNETPCWADSERLVFTSAFLLEIQRYYTIVPLAGPRRVLANTNIDGYSVPKECTVLIALRDLHFDPRIWDKPNDFNPERFIDERGTLKNIEHLYPFGLGRRRCPGDALAKSFIFIIFVGIVQKYKICLSNGTLPSAEPVFGLISAPNAFSANFIPRKQTL
ncbi:probable cytochrome P450 305a1 [Plutella xylostella]|uniref:probable cytochrome P450 305a1 n=1 Tax=Plutella xylostella TaxID=51655 RepID=UPI0005D05769|nr:probable cytochrome P450 305a1 [Plutella xylostella]